MNKNTDPMSTGHASSAALASIDNLEITPLSDDELGAVAGGDTDTTTAASCSCCVSGATNHQTNVPQ